MAGICQVMKLNHETIEKHYRHELDTATHQANAKMAETLYRAGIAGDVRAMIFWLKTRARWREVDRLEVTDPNGQPLGTGAVAGLFAKLEGIAERKALAAAEMATIEGEVVDG
tara:strand:- start:923 stop:1261 length:339 start_codon:yes stop_codon:yes gene_type:complete